MTSQTGQIIRTWATRKPQKTMALEHDYSKSKDGSARRCFYVALYETVGRTESFTKPRTRDVTHVRKCTRPSPALPYCKRREAGQGPGNEATRIVIGMVENSSRNRSYFLNQMLSLLGICLHAAPKSWTVSIPLFL